MYTITEENEDGYVPEGHIMHTKKSFMMPKKQIALLIVIIFLTTLISGCNDRDGLDPNNPVTLTLWHNYGQQMGESIGALLNEFNTTVGADKGINIQISYVADSREINERLMMAVNNDPGAPSLPDIAVIYPRIGITLAEADLLMDLSTQFSAEELAVYVPSFIEEGKLGGDTLYILPVAKSTEVLYLNSTIFNRFAEETGTQISQLTTFEGIIDVAARYYEWSGGKAFFYPENLFHIAMIGFEQLGDDFITDGTLSLSSPTYQYIWDAYYPSAVKGGTAIFDNYGNYLMATGELVCLTGSSASVTFYPDTVTFADNTKEPLELDLLPYPVFEGGENISVQRGGGMCVFKTDSVREYAAGVFLKWFTDPEQNIRFTEQTGYMPVKETAFEDFRASDLNDIELMNVRKLYETLIFMHENFTFYVPPVFEGLDGIQRNYNQSLLRAAEISRGEFLDLLDTHDPAAAFETATGGKFELFVSEW